MRRILQCASELLQLFGGTLNAIETDKESQDLIGAFKDPIDARLAQIALVGPRFHESATARDLHHLVRRSPDELTREDLAACRFERCVDVITIKRRRKCTNHRVERIGLRSSRRDLALCDLERRERSAKLRACFGVACHFANQPFACRRTSRRETQTARVECIHGNAKSLADFAKHVIVGNVHVLEYQLRLRGAANAEFANGAIDTKTRHVGPNDECRRTRHRFAITHHRRLRKRHDHTGAMSIADPVFAPVQNPAAIIGSTTRLRHDILRIRSRFGFSKRVRGECCAAREHGQIARLLFVVAKKDDRFSAKSTVHPDQYRERRINRGHRAKDTRIR